jgi:hypothetical protein
MFEIFIWKSRLNANKYVQADPTSRLIGDCRNLDPVFKRRLAALARDLGIVIVVTQEGGYRSKAEQDLMWRLYQAGELKQTAAKPYTSRHGLGIAVDTSTPPIRRASSTRKMLSEAELAKYGLYHPYAKEPWHLEPIETKGLAFAQIKSKYAPIEIGAAFQKKYGLSENTMLFIEGLYFGSEIVQKRMATTGVLDLSDIAMDQMDDYPYWPQLKQKLNVI